MESVYKIGNIGDLIKDNSYVGRGVVIGESENCLLYTSDAADE